MLINPPYAEAGSSDNYLNEEKNTAKAKVAKTRVAEKMMNSYGKATNELFAQFIARIAEEIPNATIAMFSTLKYVNATNFERLRQNWNVKYLDGFIVHCKSFDGLKGNFPIGFLIWKTCKEHTEFPAEISCEVLDKNANPIGEKSFYNIPSKEYLSNWITRPKANEEEVIGLKNCVSPNGTGKWANDAIAHLVCDGNDFQQGTQGTALLSSASKIGHKGTCFVTPENLWQVAIVFSVRQLIPHTWINHNDQFLLPNSELSDEFKSDCLVWMLFNGKNLTAGADNLLWDNREWSITNHFIPYSEEEVNALERFESDFLLRYIEKLPYLPQTDSAFSNEAQSVLEQGKKLWRTYFSATDERAVRDKFKLGRSDAGWYQIRGALKERNQSGDFPPVNFTAFENSYRTLTEKLRPQVYKYGFLR